MLDFNTAPSDFFVDFEKSWVTSYLFFSFWPRKNWMRRIAQVSENMAPDGQREVTPRTETWHHIETIDVVQVTWKSMYNFKSTS